MIWLARKPAIAPTTIHATMPIFDPFELNGCWWFRDAAPRTGSVSTCRFAVMTIRHRSGL
jgi:hypothetical protein